MADETQGFWQRALKDPYLMQVPSQRPEVLPTPGVPVGRPAPAAPLREAVVGKLRKQYPDLSDLGDDELLKGVHNVLQQDKVLPPESTVDDLLKHLGRAGAVIKIGQPGKVSNEQMNVPVLNMNEAPSEAVWPDLVKAHWPQLADLPAKDVLRGVFKEQRKNGTLAKDTTFDKFLTSLVGSGEATAKGVPGKTVRGLVAGTLEPLFGAPTLAAANALEAGAQQTPEADAQRRLAIEAAGRAAGAFATLPIAAASHLPGVPTAVKSAKQLIGEQIGNGAKAMGIYNALTTSGEVAPEVASGDMSVSQALGRVGISTALGATLGAAVEPVLGAGAHVERIAQNNMVAQAAKQLEVRNLQQAAMRLFVNDFKPEWIGSRFSDAFDPTLTDEQVARNIVAKIGNVADPAALPTDENTQNMIAGVAQKVSEYKAIQEKSAAGLGARVYPEVGTTVEPVPFAATTAPGLESTPGAPAPPEGVANIAQPLGAELNPAPGGAAPEPNTLPGGPAVEQTPPFVPPTGVKRMGGIQPVAASAAQAPPSPIVPEVAPQPPSGNVEPVRGLQVPAEGASPHRLYEPPALQGPIAPTERQPFVPPTGVKPSPGIEHAPTVEYRGPGPQGFVNTINALGTPKPGKPSVRVIDGVDVKLTPSGDNQSVRIESIRSAEPQKGAGTRVMQRLVAEADQSGTPLEVTAQPTSTKKGGRIPLPKLVDWYKSHGFQVVEEGDGFATMKRTPAAKDPVSEPVIAAFKEEGPAVAERMKGVEAPKAIEAAGNVIPGKALVRGSLGERISNQLDLFAANAEERLNKKLGRLQTGFDPTDLTDLSIIGAAKMFKLGLRSKTLFTDAMTKLYGDVILPHINDIYTKALKVLERSIAGGPTQKQMNHLMALAESGKHGMNWYEQTAKWAKSTFGDDSDMMLRFLAATSADSQTEAGATMALKAYHQWKMGMPFDGMRSKSMVMNLERAARGEQFGGDKIDSFYRALRGDTDAVVLDRWMMRALGFKNAGSAGGSGNFGGLQYRMFSEVVRDLAEQNGMTPRQFQAAIWEGARVEKLHSVFKQGGATAASKVGSARPLEQLTEARLGGRTPMQWIEENGLRFENLRNISTGLKATREGGGYSYNPFTWEPDKTPGWAVTLATRVVPHKDFYSSALTKFKQDFDTTISSSAFGSISNEQGDMFRNGQHLNIGTYKFSPEENAAHAKSIGLKVPKGKEAPQFFSIDLNAVLPEGMGERAKQIGLTNRQYQIGHIGPNGEYAGSTPTGYDPKTHGKQFLPPAGKPTEKYLDDERTRVNGILDQIGLYKTNVGRDQFNAVTLPDASLHYMVANPSTALAHAGEVMGKTPEEMKKLIDEGNFRPMSDAGVEGAVYATKDGSIWRYVDPKGPSYNTTELVGSLRGKNLVPMLDKLKGMEVLSGHDIIDSYRSQAGFARIARPKAAPDSKMPALITAMTKTGGKVVPTTALDQKSSGFGMNSYWLLPNGRLIQSPVVHMRHADMVNKTFPLPRVPGYDGAMHGAGPRVQALLNLGAIRVQSSGNSIAFDLSAKITGKQRSIIQAALKSHPDWGAQISDEKGSLVSNFASHLDHKAHHFLAAAGGEE